MAVIEQVLPPDLCLDQLPRLVNKDGRTYELAYRPILDVNIDGSRARSTRRS